MNARHAVIAAALATLARSRLRRRRAPTRWSIRGTASRDHRRRRWGVPRGASPAAEPGRARRSWARRSWREPLPPWGGFFRTDYLSSGQDGRWTAISFALGGSDRLLGQPGHLSLLARGGFCDQNWHGSSSGCDVLVSYRQLHRDGRPRDDGTVTVPMPVTTILGNALAWYLGGCSAWSSRSARCTSRSTPTPAAHWACGRDAKPFWRSWEPAPVDLVVGLRDVHRSGSGDVQRSRSAVLATASEASTGAAELGNLMDGARHAWQTVAMIAKPARERKPAESRLVRRRPPIADSGARRLRPGETSRKARGSSSTPASAGPTWRSTRRRATRRCTATTRSSRHQREDRHRRRARGQRVAVHNRCYRSRLLGDRRARAGLHRSQARHPARRGPLRLRPHRPIAPDTERRPAADLSLQLRRSPLPGTLAALKKPGVGPRSRRRRSGLRSRPIGRTKRRAGAQPPRRQVRAPRRRGRRATQALTRRAPCDVGPPCADEPVLRRARRLLRVFSRSAPGRPRGGGATRLCRKSPRRPRCRRTGGGAGASG